MPPPQSGQPIEQRAERDASQRLLVPIAINGGVSDLFLVDTGAERTVLARDLAERLRLRPGPPIDISGIAGNDRVPTVSLDSVALPGMTLESSIAPVIDRAFIGAAGLIGIDSLQRSEVLFDFEHNRLSIRASRKRSALNPPPDRDGEVVVVATRRAGRMIITDAIIAGVRADVIVDTGAGYCIGNLALRDALRAAHRLDATEPTMVRGVTGHVLPGEAATLDRVVIGGVGLQKLIVAFAPSPAFAAIGLERKPALLLGVNALRAFRRVAIDFANRRVVFALPVAQLPAPSPRAPHAGQKGQRGAGLFPSSSRSIAARSDGDSG